MIEFIVLVSVGAVVALAAWLIHRHQRQKAIYRAMFSGDMKISNVTMTGKFKSD